MVTRLITLFGFILFATSLSAQVSSDVKDVQVAKQKLVIGSDYTKYFSALVEAISVASTHNQSPTAKAVYDYCQTLLAGASGHTIRDDGTDKPARTGLNFVSTATINALATDDAVNDETEIALNIPTDGVTALEIIAGAVGTSEVADNTLTATDLAVNVVSSSMVLQMTAVILI